MKTEYREVTINRPVYIAEDGTEFSDREDCIDHEYKLLEQSLNCYNCDYEKTGVETCEYVDLATDEDVKKFIQVCEYIGVSSDGVNKPGLYMFVDNYYKKDPWVNLDDVISHIRGGLTDDQT